MPVERCGDSPRQEWNAAYYLGLQEVVTGGFVGTFEAQVALGAGRLAEKGYVVAFASDGVGIRTPLFSEHNRAARELADGSFDVIGRAREAVQWLSRHVPGVDTGWMRGLVSTYDDLHGTGPERFQGPRGSAVESADRPLPLLLRRATISRVGRGEQDRAP
ncbi:MAG: hypothetical protein HZB55_09360 [Deltaproteobacteria bacterium]|nr:hypothetical protein [Deltaproteobacteria bacterium]